MGYKFNPFTGNLDVVDTTAAAGATTQVQFNDAGAFGGDSGLTFNKTTDALSAGGFIPTSSTVPANGVYLPAANSVGVATNGTGRLFVNASGNVSVASSAVSFSPKVFNVRSTSGAVSSFSSADTVTGAADTGPVLDFRAHNGSAEVGVGEIRFAKENSTSGNNASYFSIGTRVSGGGIGERLRITSAGLVGIGTSAPTAPLEVFATINSELRLNTSADGYLQIGQFANGASIGTSSADATAGALRFVTAGSEKARFDTSGRLGIGTTSPSATLELSGTGTVFKANTATTTSTAISLQLGGLVTSSNSGCFIKSHVNLGSTLNSQLSFEVNGGALEAARIDSSGRLLVGTSSARSNFFNTTITTPFQIEGTTTTTSSISCVSNNASGNNAALILAKSNGASVGSNTLVNNGDVLGGLYILGSDGTEFVAAAQITAEVDGTPGANDMPGRLTFSTTADGAASPTERLRITSTGQVRLAGAGITFNGDTAAANELDDYEEGTWTGAISGVAVDNQTYSTYTKIGNTVFIRAHISVDSNPGDTFEITGLPFTSGATSRTAVTLVVQDVSTTPALEQVSGPTALMTNSSSTIKCDMHGFTLAGNDRLNVFASYRV